MILLIDNYDSFTFNLVHFLGDLGAEVEVVRNDAITAEEAVERADAIVLSPGPCTPNEAGICLDTVAAAARTGTPLLGVCLGHQSIGQAFGGAVIRAPQPIHGKVHPIRHGGEDVFADLPTPFQATRYHSLVVRREDLPDALTVTAETEDGLIMGLRHKGLPVHGVQFHPESIETKAGHALLRNFLNLVPERRAA